MSTIDAFSHFLPRKVLDRYRVIAPNLPALAAFERLPELWDVDVRLESLQAFPDLQQILNFGNPPVETFGDPAVAAMLARMANEELAHIAESHPNRFPAFTAVLPMTDVSLALDELSYSHDQLGARGIQIYTNVLGAPLSDERFRPIFREMARRDLPVLVHPYRTHLVADYPTEEMSEDEIWFTFGWPYETSAFAARMVYSGIFDELPDLKIVLHHFGGMIPSFGGRINLGFQQIFSGRGGGNPVAQDRGISEPVTAHFQKFYADTALNGLPSAVRAGYEFFGSERSVFGSDAPFCQDGGPSFIAGGISAIESLGLADRTRNAVLGDNARMLFQLDSAVPLHSQTGHATARTKR
ncbi:MAG: amidohydrolase [Actinomycetota bacterium]|nr:amidohydrolase [Actinomycetota bacterium]